MIRSGLVALALISAIVLSNMLDGTALRAEILVELEGHPLPVLDVPLQLDREHGVPISFRRPSRVRVRRGELRRVDVYRFIDSPGSSPAPCSPPRFTPWRLKIQPESVSCGDGGLDHGGLFVLTILDVAAGQARYVVLKAPPSPLAATRPRDSSPGLERRYGAIHVGTPEVFTRERLANDRNVQDAWLRDQLERSDEAQLGFQGLTDLRAARVLSSSVDVDGDSNAVALYRAETQSQLRELQRKERQAELQDEIDALEKLERIREVKSGTESSSEEEQKAGEDAIPGDDPAAEGAGEPDEEAPDTSSGQLLSGLLAMLKESPLPDHAITTTGAVDSPVDRLRDRLAYRDEIRNELFQNELDDRHDLRGRTAYRLNFDVTIVPRDRVNSWAVVTLTPLVPRPSEEEWKDLYREWVERLATELNELHSDRSRMLGDCIRAASTSCQLATSVRRDLISMIRRDRGGLGEKLCRKDQSGAAGAATQFGMSIRSVNPDPVLVDNVALTTELKSAIEPLVRCRVAKSGDEEAALREIEVHDHLIAKQLVDEFATQRGLKSYVTIGSPDVGTSGVVVSPGSSEAFRKRLEEISGVYAYAATPKESAQRVSEVAARRNVTQVALALAMVGGSAKAKNVTNYLKDTQELLQGIDRMPLEVGFTADDEFGWVLGPRFAVKRDRRVDQQAVSQHSVAALMSVPGWWKSLDLEVATAWRERNGRTRRNGWRRMRVELPGGVREITSALDEKRTPVLDGTQDFDVVHGQPARLMLSGRDVWRGTQVTLGAQLADRLVLLPNMSGVIAEFDEVEERPGSDGKSTRDAPVHVWTSTGRAHIGNARVHPASDIDQRFRLSLLSNRIVKGKPFRARFAEGQFPQAFATFDMGLQGRKPGDGTFDAAKTQPMAPPTKGREIELTLTDLPNFATGMDVRAVLVYAKNPTAPPQVFHSDNMAVLYLDENSSRITTTTLPTQAGEKIVFRFPPRVADAYPGFSGRPLVEVRDAQQTVSFSDGTWDPGNGEYALTMTVAANKQAEFDKRIKEGIKVTLSLTNAGNPDLRLGAEEVILKKP